MPQNQTLIQFLSVLTTLPFQISHSTLEWSNSSNSPPRPFVDRARPFPRFQTCNWSHFSSSPWKNTALQYDLWVHLTEACSENLQSFVHGTVDPRRNANSTVLAYFRRTVHKRLSRAIHHWSLITFKDSSFYCDKRTDYLLMSFHQKTEKDRVIVRICDRARSQIYTFCLIRTFRPAVTSHRSAVYVLSETVTLPCANPHIWGTRHWDHLCVSTSQEHDHSKGSNHLHATKQRFKTRV